jgi:protein ImuB
MALTQAKALAADLVAVPWEGERLARVALEVTTALLEASPRVSWERGSVGTCERARNEGNWWVDAAGLGEEKKLAQHLLRIAKKADFGPAYVGIADSAIAAYAATFPVPTLPRSRVPTLSRIVPSGRDAAFLALYPLGLLELDEDLAGTFTALGLVTVGQVAALNGDEVESRFGPEGLAAHRLARGIDGRGPTLPRDATLPCAECDLGAPVATAEPLLFVMKGALSSLGAVLRDKGLVAREITITLSLDDGSRAERSVRPARPTSHEGALFDHCRAVLENWQLDEPVTGIALRATDTVSAASEQGSLLATRWADPAALAAAFDRIRSKEGNDAVAMPQSRDGHLPADRGAWSDSDGKARKQGGFEKSLGVQRPRRGSLPAEHTLLRPPASSPSRPSALRLLPEPRSVRVRLGRRGLEAFREGEVWTDVTAWSGPDRVAPRWWEDANGTRDYFIARSVAGELWLLFRSGKQWYVEGWWD